VNLEILLGSVISGEFCIKCANKNLVIKQPGTLLANSTTISLGDIDEKLKSDGFLTEEEEKALLYEKGIWSDEKEKKLEAAKSAIIAIKKAIPEYEFKSVEKEIILIKKKELEKILQELAQEKTSFFMQTVEYNKKRIMLMALIPHCIYHNNKPYWKSIEDFENETDQSLINCIINEMSSSFYSEKQIRKLARSEPWRSIWRTFTKGGGQLFERPLSDMCKSQRDLCYWSNVYDVVFESHERPEWSIIEDDDALDLWFESQSNKDSKSSTGPISNNAKIANAKEVFVMAQTSDDAKKVYDKLGTSFSNETIRTRDSEIKKSGSLQETQLPDVRSDIQMQINRKS
jgi:hypothetical protein